MVQILPLVGAAALLAQTALAAVVPARRSYDNSYNSNSNNNYNSGNSYNSGSESQQQSENQYGSNSYNSGSSSSYNSDSNQYGSNSNSYNVGSSNQYGSSNSNSYNSGSSNQYGSNSWNSGSSNQYGSNNNNNNNENQYQGSSVIESVMATTTTSSMMSEDTNTVLQQELTTTTADASYSMPSYGSGSVNWNSGYNNCVQQCLAQFGSPSSSSNSSAESQAALPPPTGTGAVHTIMVAPDGAGLRYVPFAVNASIGDTIRYVWTTPNNHTATLSSALAICNKSGIADQRNFVSGVRNAQAGVSVFDVTVQTTDPQFFYCSVAQHCEKGMFGIINPSNDVGAANTVGTMMSSLMQSNPQLQAAYSYMMQNITGTSAENWGMGISLSGIPESQYPEVAANVLFSQGTFALNPGMLESNQGAATPDGSPIQFPSSLNVLLSDTSATSNPSSTSNGSGDAGYPSYGVASASTPTGSLTPVNNAASASGAMTARSGVSGSMMVAVILGMAGWLLI